MHKYGDAFSKSSSTRMLFALKPKAGKVGISDISYYCCFDNVIDIPYSPKRAIK